MTSFPQNPYAPGTPVPDAPVYYPAPERTSALAISSLVCSLICCIPGLGALAVLLGAGGIISISGSRGRLGGRTLAVVGIVLGLLVSMVQIAVVVGASQYSTKFASGCQTVASAVANSDAAKVRSLLGAKAASAVTDADIAEFCTRVNAGAGELQPAPIGAVGLISRYMEVMNGAQRNPSFQSSMNSGGRQNNTIPTMASFANRGTVMFIQVEGPGMSAWGPNMFDGNVGNIFVLLPDGSVVSLDPAGVTTQRKGMPGAPTGLPGVPTAPTAPDENPEKPAQPPGSV
ncbi:hypothetical protein BH11PLA1_BH11PLA1_07960 [soil metagenome]